MARGTARAGQHLRALRLRRPLAPARLPRPHLRHLRDPDRLGDRDLAGAPAPLLAAGRSAVLRGGPGRLRAGGVGLPGGEPRSALRGPAVSGPPRPRPAMGGRTRREREHRLRSVRRRLARLRGCGPGAGLVEGPITGWSPSPTATAPATAAAPAASGTPGTRCSPPRRSARTKPAAANFEFLLARVRADFGAGPESILHVAQSLFHDHVPAKAMGLATAWIDPAGRPAAAAPRPPAGRESDAGLPVQQHGGAGGAAPGGGELRVRGPLAGVTLGIDS